MALWPERQLAVDSNLLIIAVRPSEESSRYGGLIAELCRRGRPPFLTILMDGSSGAAYAADAVAATKAAATRRAVSHLGLPPERLLLIGLHDGAGSGEPAMVDALVSAFDLLSWARDCHTICVNGDAPTPDHVLARSLGERLSLKAGLGCVFSFAEAASDLQGGRLDVTRHLAAKTRALAEYAAEAGPAKSQEYLALLRAPAEDGGFWAVPAPSLAENG
jgi:LmbE family N-acetylglucosaminyl deacetylase